MSTVLAYLTLLLTVPLLAYADWKLWRLWRKYRNPVTRVQEIAVRVVLIHAFVLGWIFVNNDQLVPWLDIATTKIITRAIEVVGGLIVAVTVIWLFPLPRRKRGP